MAKLNWNSIRKIKEEKAAAASVEILRRMLTEVYTEEDKKNWTDDDYMNAFLTASVLGMKSQGLCDSVTLVDPITNDKLVVQ